METIWDRRSGAKGVKRPKEWPTHVITLKSTTPLYHKYTFNCSYAIDLTCNYGDTIHRNANWILMDWVSKTFNFKIPQICSFYYHLIKCHFFPHMYKIVWSGFDLQNFIRMLGNMYTPIHQIWQFLVNASNMSWMSKLLHNFLHVLYQKP